MTFQQAPCSRGMTASLDMKSSDSKPVNFCVVQKEEFTAIQLQSLSRAYLFSHTHRNLLPCTKFTINLLLPPEPQFPTFYVQHARTLPRRKRASPRCRSSRCSTAASLLLRHFRSELLEASSELQPAGLNGAQTQTAFGSSSLVALPCFFCEGLHYSTVVQSTLLHTSSPDASVPSHRSYHNRYIRRRAPCLQGPTLPQRSNSIRSRVSKGIGRT